MQIQVDAIKGIQIDKINVWDSMSDEVLQRLIFFGYVKIHSSDE